MVEGPPVVPRKEVSGGHRSRPGSELRCSGPWARQAGGRGASPLLLPEPGASGERLGTELALVRGMTVGSSSGGRVMGRCAVVSAC
jgi:hypothetical protein